MTESRVDGEIDFHLFRMGLRLPGLIPSFRASLFPNEIYTGVHLRDIIRLRDNGIHFRSCYRKSDLTAADLGDGQCTL